MNMFEYNENKSQSNLRKHEIANTKAITDMREEEMRVGFAEVKGEFKEVRGLINTVEAKLEGKIDKLTNELSLGFGASSFEVQH
jgi:hypothetical protein